MWTQAPYNCFASFGINNFSIWLWENPKTSIFMISIFPARTLIGGLEYAKLLCKSQKTYREHFLNNHIVCFVNLEFGNLKEQP